MQIAEDIGQVAWEQDDCLDHAAVPAAGIEGEVAAAAAVAEDEAVGGAHWDTAAGLRSGVRIHCDSEGADPAEHFHSAAECIVAVAGGSRSEVPCDYSQTGHSLPNLPGVVLGDVGHLAAEELEVEHVLQEAFAEG
jgi:hypothetical protein